LPPRLQEAFDELPDEDQANLANLSAEKRVKYLKNVTNRGVPRHVIEARKLLDPHLLAIFDDLTRADQSAVANLSPEKRVIFLLRRADAIERADKGEKRMLYERMLLRAIVWSQAETGTLRQAVGMGLCRALITAEVAAIKDRLAELKRRRGGGLLTPEEKAELKRLEVRLALLEELMKLLERIAVLKRKRSPEEEAELKHLNIRLEQMMIQLFGGAEAAGKADTEATAAATADAMEGSQGSTLKLLFQRTAPPMLPKEDGRSPHGDVSARLSFTTFSSLNFSQGARVLVIPQVVGRPPVVQPTLANVRAHTQAIPQVVERPQAVGSPRSLEAPSRHSSPVPPFDDESHSFSGVDSLLVRPGIVDAPLQSGSAAPTAQLPSVPSALGHDRKAVFDHLDNKRNTAGQEHLYRAAADPDERRLGER
jgi:hypothetical protein